MAQEPTNDVLRSIWTIPNVISILRLIILLPLTVVLLLQGHYVGALISLIILGLTDWLDGFLARALGQVSEFGRAMDPVADRLSVIIVGFALVAVGIVPWEFIAVIFVVDAVLAVVTLIWFRGVPSIQVSMIGKVRTAMVLVALPALILARATGLGWINAVGTGLLAVGTIGHVVAGIGYLLAMSRARSVHVE